MELYAKKKKTEEKALEALDAAETLEEFCANNMEAAERKAWDAAAAATAAAQNEKADHNEKPIKNREWEKKRNSLATHRIGSTDCSRPIITKCRRAASRKIRWAV